MSENNELVIETLNKRLAALEAEVSRLKKTSKGVPEDVLAAICAAVSAYLGNDGKVQAVRFARVSPGSVRDAGLSRTIRFVDLEKLI